MDQLRIPTLALDHVARLRAEAEQDRRARAARSDDRTIAHRLGTVFTPRRSDRRRLGAEPC
jgi:hypothetical protein